MEKFVDSIAEALSESDRQEHVQLFENLWGGGNPDAFSVLARSVKPRGTTGEMKTSSYKIEDADVHKNIGGSHAGVIALKALHRYFPNQPLVTNSFVERTNEHHAVVAARELNLSGIENVEVQDKSFSTLTELLENVRLLVQNDWKHLVILVNGTQVKRAEALLEKIDTVYDPADYRNRGENIAQTLSQFLALRKQGKVKISIISSEDVLERISPRHAEVVRAAKETEQWKRTQENDDKAALDILAGTYGQNRTSKPVIQ